MDLGRIGLVVLDVDGVLTDGTLYYGPDGEILKAFHVRDGLGIKLLAQQAIGVAVITAKTGGPLERRLADLGVEHAWMGREDKGRALDELCAQLGLELEQIAYVGDDIPDLPVLRRVGVAITVRDGHERVKAECEWITETPGGRGAVREIADKILAARGELERAVEAYLESQA